jgi:glutamyl-tRNA reductase
MGIVVVGLSHHTAPVTTRERVAFTRDGLPGALAEFAGLEGINEALILSTCNRVELIAHAERDAEAISKIRDFLHGHHRLAPGELDPILYELTGTAAVRHVFQVACGLDSMVVGESQIVGQMRDAYNAAQRAGCIGKCLTRLMLRTFQVARQVRGKTTISAAGWSVSRACVELAQQTLGELPGRTILVLGAGKMSQLTARHLHKAGAKNVLVTNRTYERAVCIAAQFRGEAVPFENLDQALVRSDIVISSMATPTGYVVHRAEVERALQQRAHRPMLFIDIAVPRNIDPAVAVLPNAQLSDIDALRGIVASHDREVVCVVEEAEAMIQAAVEAYRCESDIHDLAPLITALRSRVQSIGCAELKRHLCKMATSSPQDRHLLETLVRRITNKILHPLIVQLKRQKTSRKTDYIEAMTTAFSMSEGIEFPQDFGGSLAGN